MNLQYLDIEMTVQKEIGLKNINNFSLACLFIKFYAENTYFTSFEDVLNGNQFTSKPYLTRTLKTLISSFYLDSKREILSYCLYRYLQVEIDKIDLRSLILDKAKKMVSEFTCYSPIYKIMHDILDVKDNETVFNPAVGMGEIFYDWQETAQCFINGIDANLQYVDFTKIILEIIGIKSNIEQVNYYDLTSSYQADKIISFLPVGFNLGKLDENFIKLRNNDILKFLTDKPRQIETLLLDICLALLKGNGKAAILVPAGLLFRESERNFRRRILQEDILEAVIELPAKYFSHTGIATSILVFNKHKKTAKSILSINMKDIDKKEFEKIPQLVWNEYVASKKSRYTQTVMTDESCIEEAKLNFAVRSKVKNLCSICGKTVTVEEIAKNIIKGIALTKKKKQQDKERYNAFLLTAVNLIGDEIDYGMNDTIYADSNELLLQTVHQGDVIVSCRGSFKCLYVRDEPPDTLLISDNLMIIRVDFEKYNPIILAYFLNSEKGKTMIAELSSGMNMFMLSPKSLKSAQIPAYSIELANKIGVEIEQNMLTYKQTIQKATSVYGRNNQTIQKQLNLA